MRNKKAFPAILIRKVKTPSCKMFPTIKNDQQAVANQKHRPNKHIQSPDFFSAEESINNPRASKHD